jgi:drug/metabolite transporter (DMT)-like permease
MAAEGAVETPRTVGRLARAAPALFVVLWATGFVGARLTMPYAEPMALLALRFALAAALLAAIAFASRTRWPRRGYELAHLTVAGLLVQALYLGGVFAAVRLGLEAGASALIVGVQPVLTAALAGPFLGERVSAVQWAGLLLGALGVALVVAEKLGAGLGTPAAVALCLVSLAAISIGTLYQKRFCSGLPILTGTAVQFGASGVACGALALLFETRRIAWTAELVLGLAWLVLVLSCGAISLLYWLLRRGAATNVASLFFLVPPVAALMGFLFFGETMGAAALAGMGLAMLGVALVNLRRPV